MSEISTKKTKLKDFTKHKRAVNGDIGFELEVEGNGLSPMVTKVWNTVKDGSLRGEYPNRACEFVFQGPLPHTQAISAIKDLLSYQKDNGATFSFSFRTSAHVHLNVSDLDTLATLNVIYTYLLLEEVMINFCGLSRKANRFCLRLRDAEGILFYLDAFIKRGFSNIANFDEGDYRYSSLNLASLYKYGSLEFRGMRGTSEVDVLEKWIAAIISIKKYAVSMENPMEIHKEFVNTSPEAFLLRVLGKDLVEDFSYKEMEKDMEMSHSLSVDIPYLWSQYHTSFHVKEPLSVKPPLDYAEMLVKLEGLANNIIMDDVVNDAAIARGGEDD